MFDGVRDRGDRANVHSSQREAIEAQHVNDGGEIPDPRFKTQVRNVSVRSTHSAVVVTNDAPSQLSQSVRERPDRWESIAIACRVAEDVGGKYERRPVADVPPSMSSRSG